MGIDSRFLLVIIICVFAFCFDFLNGFHDAANSIATIVATRVLTPLQAVMLGGVLQLCRGISLRYRGRQDRRQRLRQG